MKVLFAAPFAVNTPHYETTLELIQRHADAGDDVLLLGCDAALLGCDANPAMHLSVCGECISRRQRGLGLIAGRVRTAPIFALDAADRMELAALPTTFTDVAALKAFTVDGADLGFGVLSSLISIQRSAVLDPGEPGVARDVRRFLVSAVAVYRSMQRHLAQERPDRVYVYNGRYGTTRAVLRACQRAGIDCYLHEVGGSLQRYALIANHLIHETEHLDGLIRTHWEATPEADRVAAATAWFEGLARGQSPTWFSYTSDQRAGLLPTGWDPAKHNVVVYNSSEDEYAAISDAWRLPFYTDQLDGLRRIIGDLERRPNVQLYLRMHPNLRGIDDDFTRGLRALSGPNFMLIPPGSPISSYALLWASDTVLTFGSTMGVEATYWGKPSVLAGESFYRRLGAAYTPNSHAELVTLLGRPLEPMAKQAALMYGHYLGTYGEPFKYFEADGIFSGRFKGQQLQADPVTRFLSRGLGRLGGRNLVRWRAERALGVRALGERALGDQAT